MKGPLQGLFFIVDLNYALGIFLLSACYANLIRSTPLHHRTAGLGCWENRNVCQYNVCTTC